MTEVNFHHGADDPLAYACRLLLKAHRRGARVSVTGAAPALQALDAALWSFDALSFVPHLRLRAGERPAERLADTPIWLVEQPGDAPMHEVLVNLGPALPVGFESYARVFEIVGRSDDERQAGRERLRHYRSRGYEIALHEVAD
jgi:DNA polymerase-3 subunit chi